MKTDILNSILGVVSEVCEVSREDLLSHCKREEVVDARCIFVHYCKEYGFQSKVVAEFLNRKRACVVDAFAADLGKVLTDEQILKAAYAFWFDDEDWKEDGKIWDYMSK